MVTQTVAPRLDGGEPLTFDTRVRVGAADAHWRALARHISGHNRMRVSRDGGKTYPRRYEGIVTDELPNQPAAVLIYDKSGSASTFCIDLDVSRGGSDAVDRDLTTVRGMLKRLGLPHFCDQSPNGGVHIYVPLAESAPHHEAAAAARALAARTPTMDPMPMLGIDSGCIRPPGARHKTGGHQLLLDTMPNAMAAINHPATRAAWDALLTELKPAQPTQALQPTDNNASVERLPARGRFTAPTAKYQQIARTGEFDGYDSPSEARQAVMWACAASGWTFSDVVSRVEDGTWPGLASMYARYRGNNRHKALSQDWNKAMSLAKNQRETTRKRSVRVGTTSRGNTHAGPYRRIRDWLNAAHLTRHGIQRDDLATRAVLQALAEAAIKTGSTTVEFGNRSLAVATGLNQATVGKVLKQLELEDRPLIDLTLPAKGIRANAWTLIIPTDLEDQIQQMRWQRGRIHGVRGAFRELGLTAAFAYAALEQATTPLSGRDIAQDAGLGHTSCYDALEVLASYGLAQRTAAGWTLASGSLDRLAEQFGITDAIAEQVAGYRKERQAWWARLGIIRFPHDSKATKTYYRDDPPPVEGIGPPPEPGHTLMDMLHDQLGAYLIDEQHASTG